MLQFIQFIISVAPKLKPWQIIILAFIFLCSLAFRLLGSDQIIGQQYVSLAVLIIIIVSAILVIFALTLVVLEMLISKSALRSRSLSPITARSIVQIRKNNTVEILAEHNAGEFINNLPDGVYGFAAANSLVEMPNKLPCLFSKRDEKTKVEIHKSKKSNVVYVVLYMNAADSARIVRKSLPPRQLMLGYFERKAPYNKVVAVPIDRAEKWTYKEEGPGYAEFLWISERLSGIDLGSASQASGGLGKFIGRIFRLTPS